MDMVNFKPEVLGNLYFESIGSMTASVSALDIPSVSSGMVGKTAT